ncbi:hypothetical protein PBI_LUCKY2013_81 [Mycobacterium phage Lucky2013]|uniref:Uncharacterized protein n=2 Tax=Omegavirus courthouse TaxID=1089119 RepID=G8I5D6_9CAUD|nr:hypothetical protein CM09_gp079 [Mycobacterium phage Courthouse]YP_009205213.1 hypothetical protein AVT17_gp083 [Mycobacterium phage Ariel]YP_009213301.1 hypothetical protein AVV70_gp084 [Mycobacterium phage MiaZeal]ASD50853.1 hypothetical protein PORCELAIN_83 [Mycobacterium phage Porcelain]ASD53474.1 hypothetical protein PBI_LUCKY2013_81 [Mycobacterium phage Lucky2013]ASZ74160.1 hypothetical protein SEA_SQUINT_84 [Mycobacterium phage Squint]ATS92924.1 hypothetical protein SEA_SUPERPHIKIMA
MTQHQNQWGEEILGLYISTLPGFSEDHWQILKLRDHDFDRRHYGREFELKKTNDSGTQGWVAGRFSREELTGLRGMITKVLEAGDE